MQKSRGLGRSRCCSRAVTRAGLGCIRGFSWILVKNRQHLQHWEKYVGFWVFFHQADVLRTPGSLRLSKERCSWATFRFCCLLLLSVVTLLWIWYDITDRFSSWLTKRMHLAVIIILHLAFRGHSPTSADTGCLGAVCSHPTAASLQALQVSLSPCCHRADSPTDSPPILSHPPSWTFSRTR